MPVAEPAKQIVVSAPVPVEIQEDEESSGIDNEEEGGQWVTPENLHKHIGAAVTLPKEEKRVEKDDGTPRFVQFVTSDYAMQNVIIQLGFKLLSLDGRRILRVKRFKLLCRAC